MIKHQIPPRFLLPWSLRKSGGGFDFAIYYSATTISVTLNGHIIVSGTLDEFSSSHKKCAGLHKNRIILTFTDFGCEQFLENAKNVRLIVDLLDLCGEEWTVDAAHVVIPKYGSNTKSLVKCLVDYCGFSFSSCAEHDVFDWMCLDGDLGWHLVSK